MKICVLDGKTMGEGFDYSRFEELGELTVFDETENSQVKERIKGYDIVIINKVVIDRESIEANDSLKMIALLSTGTNVVDLKAAKERRIAVCNVAGYSTVSVVQHTFALLLELWEKISLYDEFIKSGEYTKSGMFTSYLKQFNEISGKVWGIIGFGTIGRAVAKVAEAFGARVIFYSISGKEAQEGFESVSFNELLEKSDIISIHCALSDETKNLISEKEFKLMKKDSVIINVGRGSIINENDLAKAIDNGEIGGACLDVFENEPIKENNSLLNIKNRDKIVFTPHIAWASIEARGRLIDEVYKNINAFLCGENRNRVD